MAKNNKKKSAAEPSAKPAKKSALISATVQPFLIMALVTLLLSGAVIAVIQQLAATDIQKKAQDIHLQTMADSTASLLNIRFNYTSRQLESLATDALLQKTIAEGDTEATAALATLLQKSFNDSESLTIIPWDYTATVGLKERGIEMRNSIETLMLTRAGGNRVPSPEVYQHDKQWLVSFAQPISIDNEVKAIIFLSFNQQFFAAIGNNDFYRENAAITIMHKGKGNQSLASNNVKATGPAISHELPFTDGVLNIASARDVGNIANSALNLTYIAVAAGSVVLILLTILLYFFSRKSLLADAAGIAHYADSLSGLHRTMEP